MNKEIKEFYKLGWEILRHKCLYYYYDSPEIQDFEYDMIERKYDELAKKLELEPTAADMVGFKLDRPSCQLVLSKIQKERSIKERKK